MDQITVIIPPQVYDVDKYCGIGEMCYLHEALHNAGYKNIQVAGRGITIIDDDFYLPTERFDSEVVEEAFAKEESITVTLVKNNN